MSGYSDPILAGDGSLIRASAHSPKYASGTTGWSINKDGTAEFNSLTIRGQVIVQSNTQGIFVYSGTPATGNLIVAEASAAGTDAYGNTYVKGLSVLNTGQLVVGNSGKPQVQISATNSVQVGGIVNPGAQAVLTSGSATETHPGAISTGSSGGASDQGITVISSPIFTPTSGSQVGFQSYGTLDLQSSAKDSSSTAGATLAAIAGYPNGVAASSITCNLDGSVVVNGFPVNLLGDTVVSGSVFASTNVQAKQTANVPLGIGGSGTKTVVSVTFTALAGRSYLVTSTWHGILPGAATADNFTINISRNSTGIVSNRRITSATNQTQEGGSLSIVDTPGAGTVTYFLNMTHETGAGTAQASCTANGPAVIQVQGFA